MNLNELIERGAIFYVSHSGGKDSQAMYAHLMARIPHEQIVVVHADLGEVEWSGVQDHIVDTIEHKLNVVRASKTFLDMVEYRYERRPEVPSWPSSATRQCTSDLKRGPIYKFIRNHMKHLGATLAVNCMGLRAEESSSRAKKPEWAENATLSKAGREVYDWLPIHEWITAEVFECIETAGQNPFWAYEAGNERLSCMFCIMGSKNDIAHAARRNPKLFAKYVALEQRTGYTMFQGETLTERAGLIATDRPTQMEMFA